MKGMRTEQVKSVPTVIINGVHYNGRFDCPLAPLARTTCPLLARLCVAFSLPDEAPKICDENTAGVGDAAAADVAASSAQAAAAKAMSIVQAVMGEPATSSDVEEKLKESEEEENEFMEKLGEEVVDRKANEQKESESEGTGEGSEGGVRKSVWTLNSKDEKVMQQVGDEEEEEGEEEQRDIDSQKEKEKEEVEKDEEEDAQEKRAEDEEEGKKNASWKMTNEDEREMHKVGDEDAQEQKEGGGEGKGKGVEKGSWKMTNEDEREMHKVGDEDAQEQKEGGGESKGKGEMHKVGVLRKGAYSAPTAKAQGMARDWQELGEEKKVCGIFFYCRATQMSTNFVFLLLIRSCRQRCTESIVTNRCCSRTRVS
jgi:hypothetical protein